MIDKKRLTKFKEFDHHKLVVKIEDKESGLKGFIAIHNDNLGLPAVGGTRMFPYQSEVEALKDVLRLSRAMTYKCAIAQLPHGGAKGVIIGSPKKDKTKELLKSYAEKVNSLKGRFYTGEDVGLTEDDIAFMLKYSDFFNGKPELAGDPSPFAALSTFYSIQSAISFVYNKTSLKGIKIAIKGVGKVGKALVKLLYKEGAELFVADIDKEAILNTQKETPNIKIVSYKKIASLPVDVYAPCALGGEFSLKNVSKIKARIICGAANNQLIDSQTGDYFFENGIIYIPDYVANAGGLINVVDELEKDGYKKERVLNRIAQIKEIVNKILTLSRQNNQPPHRIADKIAESYFNSKKSYERI